MDKIKLFLKKFFMPIIFFLVLALNIWFFCMPVFKSGSYIGDNETWNFKIGFSDDTFSGSFEYKQNTSGTSRDSAKIVGVYVVEKSNIIMNGKSFRYRERDNYWVPSDYGTRFSRKNIFVIHLSDHANTVKCINAGAIVLEIFYLGILSVSGIFSIKIIIKEIKNRKC